MTILLISLFLAISGVKSENRQISGLSAYEGLHFMVGFMQNEFRLLPDGIDLNIFIASKENAEIKITYPDGITNEFPLSPDTLHKEVVESQYECRDFFEVTVRKGIRIDSDVPITVYCFSSQEESSDSYSAIPISNWGTEYVAVSQPNDYTRYEDTPGKYIEEYRESEFMIIAAENNTEVEIIYSDTTSSGRSAGDTAIVSMNSGDVYQVKSKYNIKTDGDLTGTSIKSDKPVGVLSGHMRAPMPAGSTTRDHLIEMLLPYEFWGRAYISVPFGISDKGDYIRIIGKEKGINISYRSMSSDRLYTIDNDKFFTEIEAVDEPAIWTSDKPVQFTQLMGHVDPNDPNWKDFDPSMAMLSPEEQFVQHVMFQTPGNVFKVPNQYKSHYAALVVDEAAMYSITLDGRKLYDENLSVFRKINQENDWYYTRLELDRGKHILKTDAGKFSGVLFGAGRYDSYAMVLGAALTNPELVDSVPPVIEYQEHCGIFDIEITDYEDPAQSDLLYAKVNPFRTFNFIWDEEEFKQGDKTAYIRAEADNPDMNGKLVVYAMDEAGNYSEQEFLYHRTNIKYPDEFDFDTLFWHERLCRSKSLVNNSGKEYKIISAEYVADDRVDLTCEPELPVTLAPGEPLKITLCFEPAYDSTGLDGYVKLELDCDIEKEVPVKAVVQAPALSVSGYDFGSVPIGTKEYAVLHIDNKGNIDIEIDKVYQAGDLDYILIDTSSVPAVVPPGGQYDFPVEFAPLEVKKYEMEGEASNSADIENLFKITGEGVAPEFANVDIELGNRRIGSPADTAFAIANTGNYKGALQFDAFTVRSENGVTSSYLENYSADNIEVNAEADFNVPVRIENVGAFEVIAELKTNLDLLPPVTVRISGTGTLPTIDEHDTELPPTDIYSTRNETVTLLTAGGNENLHIRNVTVLEEDEGFTYDLSDLQNISAAPGESQTLDLTFYPTIGGIHELVLLIESDAAPNYESVFDTVTVKAPATVPDIENIEIELVYDDFFNCVSGPAIIRITNSGDAPINLDGASVQVSPAESDFEYYDDKLNELPVRLDENQNSFEFDIELSPEPYAETEVSVEILIFETEKIVKKFYFTPTVLPIAVFEIDDAGIKIGNEGEIEVGGSFAYKTDFPIDFEIEINMPKNEFYVPSDTNYLFQVGSQEYDTEIYVDESGIVFSASDIVPEEDEVLWNFAFSYLSLLGEEKEFDLTAEVRASNCFDPAESSFTVVFDEVCGGEMREIVINPDIEYTDIYPNPANNELMIEVGISQETTVNVSLFDISGKKIKDFEEKILPVGQYLLNYGLQGVPNGNYFLKINLNGKIENKFVIINK